MKLRGTIEGTDMNGHESEKKGGEMITHVEMGDDVALLKRTLTDNTKITF